MKKVVSGIMMISCLTLSAAATLVVDLNPPSISVNPRNADTSTTTEKTWDFSDSSVLIGSGGGANDKVYGGMTTGWSVASESAGTERTFDEAYMKGLFAKRDLNGDGFLSIEELQAKPTKG